MTVRTRFAPSPTGMLHIGGARTALFNWLFAKHHGGQFLLRVEDTDLRRSTDEAKEAILEGLEWLGLFPDESATYQSQNAIRHKEIAEQLIEQGKAYYCYATAEELQKARDNHKRFISPWRDGAEPIDSIKPSVRIKAPLEGSITLQDMIQGEVTVPASELDDLIILRSDGTPTYMLAVVVDDHDMNITHIIRGDDHLTNSFRQKILFDALGWDMPQIAHIPLIHGSDGAKLSKRHGALGVGEYQKMGFLPDAVCNYLLRLGWGHGDDEIISTQQAIEWFDIDGIGKSPSRLDMEKLSHINKHYMREMPSNDLAKLIAPNIEQPQQTWLQNGLPALVDRVDDLNALQEQAAFYIHGNKANQEAQELIDNNKELLSEVTAVFSAVTDWSEDTVKDAVKQFAKDKEVKMGAVGMPLRAALTGTTNSPSIFNIMAVLGKEETLKRLAS